MTSIKCTIRSSDPEPAVPCVYEWLPKLYEMVERRYVAVDARIQNLVGVSVALFVGVGAFLKAGGITFSLSGPAIVAFVILGLQMATALIGLAYGRIRVFGLTHIIEQELDLREPQFKRKALDWANSDLAQNRKVVNIKGWLVWGLVIGLIAETAVLFWWIKTISP